MLVFDAESKNASPEKYVFYTVTLKHCYGIPQSLQKNYETLAIKNMVWNEGIITKNYGTALINEKNYYKYIIDRRKALKTLQTNLIS